MKHLLLLLLALLPLSSFGQYSQELGLRTTVIGGQPIKVPDDSTCAVAQFGVSRSKSGNGPCEGDYWFVHSEGSSEVLVCVLSGGRVLWGIILTVYSKQLSRVHVIAEATIRSLEGNTLFLAKYSSPFLCNYSLLVLSCGGVPYYALSGDILPAGDRIAHIEKIRKRISDESTFGRSNGYFRL